MTPCPAAGLEGVYHRHLAGEWDSLRRWAWLYVHAGTLLATALVGYTVAHGRYALTALLLPLPAFFLARRYTYARPNE